MEVGSHVKTKWSIRGDWERTVTHAWENGVDVTLPNYTCSEARVDEETDIALLSNGGKITTVVVVYDHMEIIPNEEVECLRCGETFAYHEDCLDCGASNWRSI